MKTITTWLFVPAFALALAACDPSSTDSVPPVCTPAPFTTPFPGSATQYCLDYYGALCQRAFSDCGAQLSYLVNYFGDVQTCDSYYDRVCPLQDYSGTGVNSGCAGLCILTIQTGDCTMFTGAQPTECANATGYVPPQCTSIAPGVVVGAITASDSRYQYYRAKSYCIQLTAGQTLTLTTSASGTANPDTLLWVLDSTGTLVAYNNDINYPSNVYSHLVYVVPATGTYQIIVGGYYTGGYELTVTVE